MQTTTHTSSVMHFNHFVELYFIRLKMQYVIKIIGHLHTPNQ